MEARALFVKPNRRATAEVHVSRLTVISIDLHSGVRKECPRLDDANADEQDRGAQIRICDSTRKRGAPLDVVLQTCSLRGVLAIRR